MKTCIFQTVAGYRYRAGVEKRRFLKEISKVFYGVYFFTFFWFMSND